MNIKEAILRLKQLHGDVTVNDVIMKDPVLHIKKLSALDQTIKYFESLKEIKLTATEDFRDLNKEIETLKHYDNTKGSLYAFAEHHNLNPWEFDALKRIIKIRKKGAFEEDINKTITVLELYKKEYKKI